jgi:hypothetical protein
VTLSYTPRAFLPPSVCESPAFSFLLLLVLLPSKPAPAPSRLPPLTSASVTLDRTIPPLLAWPFSSLFRFFDFLTVSLLSLGSCVAPGCSCTACRRFSFALAARRYTQSSHRNRHSPHFRLRPVHPRFTGSDTLFFSAHPLSPPTPNMLPLEAGTNDPSATKPEDHSAVQQTDNERSQEERRVVRKLDMILMPILLVSFGLQYWDKVRFSRFFRFPCLLPLPFPLISMLTSHLPLRIGRLRFLRRLWPPQGPSPHHLPHQPRDGPIGRLYPPLLHCLFRVLLGLHRCRLAVRSVAAEDASGEDLVGVDVPFFFFFPFLHFALVLTTFRYSLIWGVVALLTVVCHSYEGVVVQRVFLGVLEVRIFLSFVSSPQAESPPCSPPFLPVSS